MSPVSNHVYERRLIEKYIAENGTDPINNQPLSEEQLIDIKGAWRLASAPGASLAQSLSMGGGDSTCSCRPKGEEPGKGESPGFWLFIPTFSLLAVAHPIRPKPPSATSIPAILKALQDEWVSLWAFPLEERGHCRTWGWEGWHILFSVEGRRLLKSHRSAFHTSLH